MRTAAAIAPAVLAVCFACTYNIPDVVGGVGGGGSQSGDASIGDASTDDGTASDGSGAGTEGSTATDAPSSPPPDANGNAGVDAPCSGLLCPCSQSSDCSSNLCTQSATIGPSLYAGTGSFCTTPCCTSADCGTVAVCFGTGQGGNYCVNPSWLARSSTLGTAHGGASCSQDSECRSGLCTGSTCADTCCSLADSSVECAGAGQCTFGAFSGRVTFDRHLGGRCGPPNSGSGLGVSCNDPSQCAGGLCVSGGCSAPCHSPSECGTNAACQLGVQSGDIYAACYPWSATGAQGTPCSGDGACKGNWCLDSGLCTNACYTDADCVSGWHCTPTPDALPGATGDLVLACTPP